MRAGLDPEPRDGAAEILVKLYDCYIEGDADLVEINPLVLTTDGEVRALDAKVTLDDDAAFRHPEWAEIEDLGDVDERERLAKEKGLQYIGLDGSVGIIANGAGLAMSTLDVVNQVGGAAANFLDIGGGADADVMANALEVINTDPNVRVDPRQHLRRDRPLRRRRPRDPRRARAGRHRLADRAPSRRHERGRGATGSSPTAASEQIISEPTMLSAARRAVELAAEHAVCGRFGAREHLRRRDHAGGRPGTHREPGPLPRPAQPRLRHQGRRRRHPGQGRPGRRGHPGLRLGCRGGRATGADASFVAVPPRAAPAAILDAAAAGIRLVVCITEHIPAKDEALVNARLVRDYPGTRLIGPNCPGIISPGKCNIGITSGDIALPGGPGRDRQPLGHLDLSGPARALPAGRRPDDLRRHRRRPGPGHDVRRRARRLPGRPGDAGGHDDRRDRRRRRGAGGGLHRRRDGQAGRRLHRRRDRARRAARWATPAPSSPARKGTAKAKMEALSAAGVLVAKNPTEAGELMVGLVRALLRAMHGGAERPRRIDVGLERDRGRPRRRAAHGGAHADVQLPRPERAHRLARRPQGGEPAADGLVQDPRRRRRSSPHSATEHGPASSSPRPATTPRRPPSRRARRACRARCSCRRRPRSPRRRRRSATARRCISRASRSTTASSSPQARARETGLHFVHPFDDPAIVAGQGTLGLELVEDVDDLAMVIVPLGGGGLVVRDRLCHRRARLRASRSSLCRRHVCAPFLARPRGRRARRRSTGGPTLADGIAVKRPSGITLDLIERHVDEIVAVGENEIADAMVMLLMRSKLVVEGAGAVGAAALMDGRVTPPAVRHDGRACSPAATSTPGCCRR